MGDCSDPVLGGIQHYTSQGVMMPPTQMSLGAAGQSVHVNGTRGISAVLCSEARGGGDRVPWS